MAYSTLLFVALAGMAVAHPQMRQHITTVSMSNLEAAVDSGRTATSRELSTRLVPSLLMDSALTMSVPSNPSASPPPPASMDPSGSSLMTPSRDSLMSSPTEKPPPNA